MFRAITNRLRRHTGSLTANRFRRAGLLTLVAAAASSALVLAPAQASATKACTVHTGVNINRAGAETQRDGVNYYNWGNSPWIGVRYTFCPGHQPRLDLLLLAPWGSKGYDYYTATWTRPGIRGGQFWTNFGGDRQAFGNPHRNTTYTFGVWGCDRHWYGDECHDGTPWIRVSTED